MKTDLRCSLVAKVCALFLVVLLTCGMLFCAFGVVYLDSGGAYDGGGSYYKTGLCEEIARTQADSLYWMWKNDPSGAWADDDTEGGAEMGFSIADAATGDTLLRRNVPEQPLYSLEYRHDGILVTVWLSAKTSGGGAFSFSRALYERLLPQAWTLIWCFCALLLCGAALTVFLCCAAGHRRGEEHVLPSYLDRMPFDLWLVLAFLGCALCVAPFENMYYSGFEFTLSWLALYGACVLGFLMLLLTTLLTFATRVKLGKWWRNTILYRVWRLLWRMVRGVWRALAGSAHALPLVWRSALIFFCFALFQFLLSLAAPQSGFALLTLLAMDLCGLFFVCRVTMSLKTLREGGERLARGDAEYRVETAKMPRTLREHGENLNSIGDGISIAVDRQLRSERMKTELITNVSHDIKTPLTSILNYVDLLQKDPTPEQQREYLAVLDRQAKRLKKLTEDLVEASKAATGNLTVALERTDLCELLRQAAGEYEERLAQNDLTTVLSTPEEPVFISADGRLLWRVIDNLLGNACKYAQPGTRVYLDVRRIGEHAVFTARNISRQQLNIDPDELMERFVRGDSSRNTEGSGLGLNIARSLTELQHGALELAIDGDLFKATASFPVLE